MTTVVSLRLLTLVHGVRGVNDEQREVPITEVVRQYEGDVVSHSQEEGLGSRQSPPTLDKFRRRDIRTCGTERQELTSKQAESEPLRPYASKSSPKGLEKHQRRVEPDPWSWNIHGHGPSAGIGFILELERD